MFKKTITTIGVLLLCTSLIQSQKLTQNQLKELHKKVVDIQVNSVYEKGNWIPFLKQVEHKKIVLLGEFNHGSKEVFVSRNDLIKSLHKNLDFDVILFESGIGELAAIDLYRNKMSAAQMTLGFFAGWRTQEFENLMTYVKDEKIAIAGFDVQRFGSTFERFLEVAIDTMRVNASLNKSLEKRFDIEKKKLSNKNVVFDTVQESTLALIEDYEKLLEVLKDKSSKGFGREASITKQTISNRIEFLRYQLSFKKDNNWNKRWRARDLAMAKNVEWLIESFYSDKKIIIIGHNFHIARYNEKEDVMGEFLQEKFGSSMYSVGVFAKTGSYIGNFGNEESLSPLESNQLDIKTIIGSLNGRLHFLDIQDLSKYKFDWLFNQIVVNDTFIDLNSSNTMILSKHFDGLLLLDKISAPQPIKWN